MSRWFRRFVLFVFVIKVDQPIAVSAVRRQDDQHDEIRDQQSQIEGIDLVKALESLIQKMLAKVGPPALGNKNNDQGQLGERGRNERQIHELNRTSKEREQPKHCTGSVVGR